MKHLVLVFFAKLHVRNSKHFLKLSFFRILSKNFQVLCKDFPIKHTNVELDYYFRFFPAKHNFVLLFGTHVIGYLRDSRVINGECDNDNSSTPQDCFVFHEQGEKWEKCFERKKTSLLFCKKTPFFLFTRKDSEKELLNKT